MTRPDSDQGFQRVISRRVAALTLWLSGLSACGAPLRDSTDPPDDAPGATEDATVLTRYFGDNKNVLPEHHAWHHTHRTSDRDYGESFLLFHYRLITAYDDWRLANGLPELAPWDPAEPIPVDVAHAGRMSNNPLERDARCARPAWLTLEGNDAVDPQTGARRLADFTSANQLGWSIDPPGDPAWHSAVHNAVGGDMGDMFTAPKDPIFWRFHKTIQLLVDDWLSATGRTRDALGQ